MFIYFKSCIKGLYKVKIKSAPVPDKKAPAPQHCPTTHEIDSAPYLIDLLSAPEDILCPLSEDLLLLRNYLLAATAKDLSIFLTVRRERADAASSAAVPSSSGGVIRLQLKDVTYCVSISLIDLDPKHVHKISKYVSKKIEWLAALQYWK